ncbi:hypothetical protein [Tomitella cavernea]|nr:hypothetical protein [Tomitella cavernea]
MRRIAATATTVALAGVGLAAGVVLVAASVVEAVAARIEEAAL